MSGWLRRVFGISDMPSNRGTLTFLADGKVIVGLPDDVSSAASQAVMDQFSQWLADGGLTVIFPWPVDVTDNRPR